MKAFEGEQSSETADGDLAERFRAAMRATSPEFSPDLHAEVMNAIHAERSRSSRRSPRPSRWRIWSATAFASAAAAVVAFMVMRPPQPTRPQAGGDPRPTLAKASLTLPRFPDPTTLVDPMMGRLDRIQRDLLAQGVNRLHRYWLDQLRIIPSGSATRESTLDEPAERRREDEKSARPASAA